MYVLVKVVAGGKLAAEVFGTFEGVAIAVRLLTPDEVQSTKVFQLEKSIPIVPLQVRLEGDDYV